MNGEKLVKKELLLKLNEKKKKKKAKVFKNNFINIFKKEKKLLSKISKV